MNSTYRERIETLWSACGQPGTMEDFVADTIALIQEVAKSAKPEPETRCLPSDIEPFGTVNRDKNDGYVHGFNKSAGQYEQNIKELLGGSSE